LVDLRAAGNQHAAAFPKNLLLVIVSQVVRSLAVWFVKSAIRDAATELGISLSEEEGQLLASLAVDALAA